MMRNMETISQKKENDFLYALKAIASFLVILIHFPVPGTEGSILEVLGRGAVPIFFIINGKYLSLPEDRNNKEELRNCRQKNLRKVWKIAKMTVGVLAVYTFFSFCSLVLYGYHSVPEWVEMKYNIRELLGLLLFNSSKVIYDELYYIDHLWYLFALIYVILLVCVFMKYMSKWMNICMLLPLCILLPLTYAENVIPESFVLFGLEFEGRLLMRNWFFTALPFMGFGILLQRLEKSEKCRKYFRERTIKVLLVIIFIFGEGWCVYERLSGGESKELFAGTVLAAVAVTSLSLGYANCRIPGLSFLGKQLSGSIYYWHPLIAIFVFQVVLRGKMGDYFSLWLVVLTILVAAVICLWKTKWSKTMGKKDIFAIRLMVIGVIGCFLFCIGFWQYGMQVRKESMEDVTVIESSENVLFFVNEVCYNQKGDAQIFAWSKNGEIHYPFHNWVLDDSDEEYKIAQIVLTDGKDSLYVLKTYPYEMNTDGVESPWILDYRDGCVAYVEKEYCQMKKLSIAVLFTDREGKQYILYQEKEYEKYL